MLQSMQWKCVQCLLLNSPIEGVVRLSNCYFCDIFENKPVNFNCAKIILPYYMFYLIISSEHPLNLVGTDVALSP